MKCKKIIKFINIVLIILLLFIFANNSIIYAKSINTDITIDSGDGKQFEGLGNSILSVVYVIGVFVAVGALMIKGIKFMLGSAEEKSEEKKVLIYYLIGAIMVIAIPKVVELIYKFADGLF